MFNVQTSDSKALVDVWSCNRGSSGMAHKPERASYSVLSSFYLVFDANIGRVFGLVGTSDYKREYEYTTQSRESKNYYLTNL